MSVKWANISKQSISSIWGRIEEYIEEFEAENYDIDMLDDLRW